MGPNTFFHFFFHVAICYPGGVFLKTNLQCHQNLWVYWFHSNLIKIKGHLSFFPFTPVVIKCNLKLAFNLGFIGRKDFSMFIYSLYSSVWIVHDLCAFPLGGLSVFVLNLNALLMERARTHAHTHVSIVCHYWYKILPSAVHLCPVPPFCLLFLFDTLLLMKS